MAIAEFFIAAEVALPAIFLGALVIGSLLVIAVVVVKKMQMRAAARRSAQSRSALSFASRLSTNRWGVAQQFVDLLGRVSSVDLNQVQNVFSKLNPLPWLASWFETREAFGETRQPAYNPSHRSDYIPVAQAYVIDSDVNQGVPSAPPLLGGDRLQGKIFGSTL